jgi:hypothetical protein
MTADQLLAWAAEQSFAHAPVAPYVLASVWAIVPNACANQIGCSCLLPNFYDPLQAERNKAVRNMSSPAQQQMTLKHQLELIAAHHNFKH